VIALGFLVAALVVFVLVVLGIVAATLKVFALGFALFFAGVLLELLGRTYPRGPAA
jgi:hypothetical protein